MSDVIDLNGLDGANPLGFLAALGTLVLADHIWPGATMAWRRYANSFRPSLRGATDSPDELVERLIAWVREDVRDDSTAHPRWANVDSIKDWTVESFRRALEQSLTTGDARGARLLVGFASDAVPKNEKEPQGPVKETNLSHANGQGEQHLLKFYRQMVEMSDADALRASLFDRWRYAHAKPRFRWDPIDGRNFSTGVGSANTEPAGVELGANLLAFNAFELIPCYPTTNGLVTIGYARLSFNGQRAADYFTWPLWEQPVGIDVVRSLLALPGLSEAEPDHARFRSMGVAAIMRSRRIVDKQKNLFFSEAVAC